MKRNRMVQVLEKTASTRAGKTSGIGYASMDVGGQTHALYTNRMTVRMEENISVVLKGVLN